MCGRRSEAVNECVCVCVCVCVNATQTDERQKALDTLHQQVCLCVRTCVTEVGVAGQERAGYVGGQVDCVAARVGRLLLAATAIDTQFWLFP